jgi:hypothetical protein
VANENTLLGMMTGGRVKHTGVGKYEGLPGAAPTIPEMADSYMNQIIDAYDESEDAKIVGHGLGVAEWAGGPAKAMALMVSPKSSKVNFLIDSIRGNREVQTQTAKMAYDELSRILRPYRASSFAEKASPFRNLPKDVSSEAGELKKIIDLSEGEIITSRWLENAMHQWKNKGFISDYLGKSLRKSLKY